MKRDIGLLKRMSALAAQIAAVVCIALGQTSHALAHDLSDLKVNYRDNPIGIDDPSPRFSWRTTANDNKRGVEQSAYRIIVRSSAGTVVWDTGQRAESGSLDIPYAGTALEPATRYAWTLTTWDKQRTARTAEAWFETGILNPDPALSGWDGATWIGGSPSDLVLYAQYLSIFDLRYTLAIKPGSHRAAVILAANDPRLMDPNKNIFQLNNARNDSYFKVELDISPLAGRTDAYAHLNVYRAGYSNSDDPRRPVKIFKIKNGLINANNGNSPHHIQIRDEFGKLTISIDGTEEFYESQPGDATGAGRTGSSVNLNPAGEGGDALTYGYLCEIGFALDPGETAYFSDLVVANVRAPSNDLFSEPLAGQPYAGIFRKFVDDEHSGLRINDGAYEVSGGARGAFIVGDPSRNSMPMLRSTFEVGAKPVRSARLYATSRGIYELYLNGQRVGEDFYDPGLTQYNRTQLYQTYDVTSLVGSGKNAIGAILGEGWWSGLLSFGTVWNHFGDRQSLLAKLVVTYQDGSHEVVTTNERSWKYFNQGPIVYSSLYMGEVYDATREARISDWTTSAYDDRAWHAASAVPLAQTAFTGRTKDFFGGESDDLNYEHLQLVGQIGDPAKTYQVFTARSVKEVRKGVFVYDMGQNLVGVPRIRFLVGESGRRVIIRVSEMLYPGDLQSGANVGMIMTENYRAALSEDQYVMRAGAQTFEPHFTSHGYQYIEITGLSTPLPLSQVQALSISSVQSLTASFESSNVKVNRLWSNIEWSNIDNFLTIPTDCPQRNERMGWSGDISVFSRTATYLSNADPFLDRHLIALRDTQSSAGRFSDVAPVGGGFGGVLWGSAGITIAWELYQQYGDVAALEEHYPAMVRYIEYLSSTLDPKTGLSTDGVLGDWLGPQYDQLGPAFLVTAYHAYDLRIMARVAEVLGKGADAAKYQEMYLDRKRFFNDRFVNADKKTVGLVGGTPLFPGGPRMGNGEYRVADTQTSYAVPLALGVFRDEDIPQMQRNLAAAVSRENPDDQGVLLRSYSLMTGFIGTAWISDALSISGRADLAYRLLENDNYPSWLYPIDQGATTIWERLNGYTVENGFGGNNGMNSFNHYSFGAVGQWLVAYSLGIQRDEPGFKKFILQPEPDPTGQMTWAKGHYDSPYGRIESGWRLDGKRLSYTATVPANTTATLLLPTSSPRQVTESGKPASQASGVLFERYENGNAVYRLSSGTYRFDARGSLAHRSDSHVRPLTMHAQRRTLARSEGEN